MRKRLNLKIKFRESFRPFAPAIREEDAPDYFELNDKSPYMLMTAPLRERHRLPRQNLDAPAPPGLAAMNVPRSILPAVTHVDFSARAQTVSREGNPFFHALLGAFKAKTGCPALVNTSFNVRGEPIVCTPEDAIACFLKTGMDALALENFLLLKNARPAAKAAPPREASTD